MSTNDSIKTMNDLTNKTVERLTSLGELNVRIFEKMASRQMDVVNLYMDHSMRIMNLATESKGYNDFFKGQVEATKELSERVMAEGKTTMQLANEARDDYRAWFEKNLAEVSSDLQKSVPANA
ncbi:phasin family protein [Thiorhodococcus drewsii AZ1]|uniref:Phasin family protein n=1 Tax=Thiorhodococcus drewsii AZ1 TaxID=765913 RepID=G2DVQ4_9GAMM|nr:phasin family protein [Thiorhodococcus drewsii]EGV34069.1 phasin family protein [Thiorhodococcus drewsii AZ1]